MITILYIKQQVKQYINTLSHNTNMYIYIVWTILNEVYTYWGKVLSIRHRSYVNINGGANGVMVNVVGNGHDDTSSNPGQDWLHFT